MIAGACRTPIGSLHDGPEEDLPLNVVHLVARAGTAFSEKPAIAIGKNAYCSYGDLYSRVSTMAGRFLDQLHLKPGDRIALAMQNCAEFLEVMYAAWHAGLCTVPINARLHAREFQYILENSGARCCFVTADLLETIDSLRDLIPSLEYVGCVSSSDYKSLRQGKSVRMAERSSDDPAWIFYTSGTTGRPKGAVLSHRNLMALTLNYFVDVDSVSSEDCILHAAPLSHGSGLYNLSHVAVAAKQVIPASGRFNPDEVFDLIVSHEGMTIFAAPTMVKRLVDHPTSRSANTSNLKTIVYGGAPMYVADLKQAINLFGNKLVQIYGLGESPMTITALSKGLHAEKDHARFEERLQSAGVPQSVVEVRVVDSNDRVLPPGEIGEVIVRGDVVMCGYWENPEATETTMRNGWLHTGDMGTFDEDGFLTLKDRSKDLIISGGSNIYPREVEEVLLMHGAVQEVSVIGRPHPEWGEEVVAFVVAEDAREKMEDELDVLCLDHIARFKRPRAYFFVDSLPKNNYGKILKTELRQWLDKEDLAG